MTTEVSGGPGAFRRLMNKVARWSEAMDHSGFDYTFDRIAFVERELAALKDRMRQFEASRPEPPDVPPDALRQREHPIGDIGQTWTPPYASIQDCSRRRRRPVGRPAPPSDGLQRTVRTMRMRADPGCLLADLVLGHLQIKVRLQIDPIAV
jgi:hypothetical protein